jgi:hypothetical protein
MRRKGCIISTPPAVTDESLNTGATAGAVSTAAGGIKLTFTLPAGQQGVLDGATFAETTGTGVIAALQLVRAAVTFTLASFTTQGSLAGPIALQPGDTVQWNVTTPIGASVSDFTLAVALDQGSQRITISFTNPAVPDQGIILNPGQLPLELMEAGYGDALTSPIFAIANSGTPTIGVLDVFGP